MGSLSRRVAALETARVDRLYQQEAERLAELYGGSVAARLEELRATAAEMAARFGPCPDWREVARWAAAEHGVDPDAVYREMMALKEKR